MDITNIETLTILIILITLIQIDAKDAKDGINDKKTPSAVLAMCDDGLPDVVVTLGNDDTLIFKQHSFWKVGHGHEVSTSKKNVLKLISKEEKIVDKFGDKIKTHLDMAITSFGEVSMVMDMYMKTIFVKGTEFFLFDTYQHVKSGNIDLWFKDPNVSNRDYFDKVMYQKEDSISVYKSRPLFDHAESAMSFDDADRPENIEAIRNFDTFDTSVKHVLTSASIQSYYLIPSNGTSFYLFYQFQDLGYVCYLQKMASVCDAHQIASLFTCPDEIGKVRKKHLLGRLMTKFKVSTHDYLLMVVGVCLASVLIILILIVVTFINYYALRVVKIEMEALDENVDNKRLTLSM